MVKVQDRLQIDCVFQFCLGADGRDPLDKVNPVTVDAPYADVCVSYVNGKYHVLTSEQLPLF